MKTVPTALAAATVISASALGLSFGKPLETNKRKATPVPELEDNTRAMPSAVQTSSTTTTPLPLSSPIPLSAASSRPTRASHDGRRRIMRRMTSGDTSLRPHEAMNDGYAPPHTYGMDDFDPSTVPSRASWIKRLSTVSTSHNSSRNTSPGPLSPSISCSNGSMAFSHDGSTAPIIGKRAPSPLPPNKLVKRSSSVRGPREQYLQASGSRLPSLRRPATSHQRSATLQQQSALAERDMEEYADVPPVPSVPPIPVDTEHDERYTQFFSPKAPKESTLSKRRNSLVNGRSLKRIYPDGKHKPTLLLAKSVSASADEADELSSEDSVYYVSRPATPPTASFSYEANRGRAPEVNEDVPPRRFSIGDFWSNPKKPRASSRASAKLSRRPSQRVVSAPLPAMGSRQSNTAHGDARVHQQRRDLTEPAIARRPISTSAGHHAASSRDGLQAASSPLTNAPLPPQHTTQVTDDSPATMRQREVKPAWARTNQIPPSPTLAHTGGRPSRHSVAPSEQASTLVGSDNEARGIGSGEDDDADVQSETLYDSLRTGATRSTSGAPRGPRIETIFDESPPSKVKVTALRDLLPKGTFRDHAADGAPGNQSIAEEEESISTPVRTVVPERTTTDSPSLSRAHGAPLFPSLIPSSPPDMPKPLSLGTLEWDARAGDDDDSSRWSLDEDNDTDSWGEPPECAPATHVATPVSLGRHNPRLLATGSSPKPSTPQNLTADHNDRDARSSIFDWSEQQPTDKSSGNRTPPRPRTVHGKKDADGRGSRSVGRRVPSGLHARSQSVPVVPDITGKRTTVVTNKFGTWGVGSKGVTEDWNDDFDFDNEDAGAGAAGSQRVDSGTAMLVPKTIQEQQSNVLANIGLLREWGLLIEELKEQRVRATSLGLLEGPNAGMWEEVDAMIDLADQEAEHDGIPRVSPPSSPGFDEDAFDDVSGPSPNHGRGRRKSGLLANDEPNNSPGVSHPRKSILTSNRDIFGPQSSPIPTTKHASFITSSPQQAVVTRPRKDSEAKARSVIEALQKRRSTHEAMADLQLAPAANKVPFDTATLRRIVPYVSALTRKVKEALREAEGLVSSPSTSPQHEEQPPFSRIFQNEEMAKQMKLMTVM